MKNLVHMFWINEYIIHNKYDTGMRYTLSLNGAVGAIFSPTAQDFSCAQCKGRGVDMSPVKLSVIFHYHIELACSRDELRLEWYLLFYYNRCLFLQENLRLSIPR